MRLHCECGRRAQLAGFAALLAAAAPAGGTWRRASAAAAPKCSYAALEALPAVLTQMSALGIRNDLRGAQSLLAGEALLADPAALTAAAGACTPDDDTLRTQVARALADLSDELDFQIAKGVSDPRAGRDPDDVGDLQRRTLKARSALQRYVDLVEKNAGSGAALRLRGGARKLGPAPTPDLRFVSPPASDAANAVANPLTYPVGLYPEVEPHEHGMLDVGDGHRLYYDVSGNPEGVPALFLHGGPGAGCSPRCRRFFDPAFYRIVLLDQRGAGRSVPNAADDLVGALVENATPELVGDLEALRMHLGIRKWGLVLGGSWGSTLALAYAQAHPAQCEALLLRGVFLFSPTEVDYLFGSGGTAGQNPQAWEEYCRFVRETSDDWERESANLLGAYWQRLTCDDEEMRNAAAAAFIGYELSISKAYIDPAVLSEYLGTPSILIPFAVMEVHYMLNGGFLRRGQLLDQVALMAQQGHKVAIVHGRADYVCQPQAAWRLCKALRAAGCEDVELEFVAGAGHSDSEPGLVDAMVRATDRFKAKLMPAGQSS